MCSASDNLFRSSATPLPINVCALPAPDATLPHLSCEDRQSMYELRLLMTSDCRTKHVRVAMCLTSYGRHAAELSARRPPINGCASPPYDVALPRLTHEGRHASSYRHNTTTLTMRRPPIKIYAYTYTFRQRMEFLTRQSRPASPHPSISMLKVM